MGIMSLKRVSFRILLVLLYAATLVACAVNKVPVTPKPTLTMITSGVMSGIEGLVLIGPVEPNVYRPEDVTSQGYAYSGIGRPSPSVEIKKAAQ